MQQLLPKEFVAKPDLQWAIIIEFDNKKTSILLKKFAEDQYLTIKNLTHLKRIKKSETNPQNIQFFLRLKEDFNEEIENSLPEEIKPYTLHEQEVVVNNPRTKINETMKKCIEQAKQSFLKGNKFNACAIYDPVKKEVLEVAGDETSQQQASIQHCVMNVMKKFGENYIVTAQQKHLLDKPKSHTYKGKEKDAEFDTEEKEEYKKDDKSEDKGVNEESNRLNIKRKSDESIEDCLSSYYYCTGLDLYIVQEPCIMCSMALSRFNKLL